MITTSFGYGKKPLSPEVYRRIHPDRVVLDVTGNCILPNEELFRHAAIARASGFPEFRKAQIPPYEDPLAMIGAGLSANDFVDVIKEIATLQPIMAVKGAHDWLIEHGITPTYAIAADPQQSRHDCFKHLNDETIYLMASQMHPDTWPYMRGRKVILWHSEIDWQHRSRPEYQGVPLVPGGPTTGLRAISLAYFMGFREIDLFGFDSCVRDGIYRTDGKPVRDDDQELDVWVGEKQFRTSVALVPQVTNLRATLFPLTGIRVRAYGDGYFQEVLAQGKAAGWPV